MRRLNRGSFRLEAQDRRCDGRAKSRPRGAARPTGGLPGHGLDPAACQFLPGARVPEDHDVGDPHPGCIAVAAFNIVSMLFMVVKDKEADIAILKTLGFTPAG